jgi:hypothetical protein
MQTQIDRYRTRDGTAHYSFSFEEQSDGTWLSVILDQLPYDGQPDGLEETHRGKTEGDPRYHVAWPRPLLTLVEAKSAAALWCEENEKYRRNTPAFENFYAPQNPTLPQ